MAFSQDDRSSEVQTTTKRKIKNPVQKGCALVVNVPMPQRNSSLPYQQESVGVVVPVYDEQEALPKSIPALRAYLETYFPYRWSVVIADNASTDATLDPC